MTSAKTTAQLIRNLDLVDKKTPFLYKKIDKIVSLWTNKKRVFTIEDVLDTLPKVISITIIENEYRYKQFRTYVVNKLLTRKYSKSHDWSGKWRFNSQGD